MPTIRINQQVASGQTPQALGLNLAWSKPEQAAVADIISRYPAAQSRSAVIPLLWLAQRKCGGWLPVDAMRLVADTLSLPYMRVYEVATFYTMFNLTPVGKFHVQICTNCSCLVRGSDAVLAAAQEFTGIAENNGTSADGLFTITEVECLGACVAAPMMQVGTHYYTNLDAAKLVQVLTDLKTKGYSSLVDTAPAGVDPISRAGCGG
jgi:NADH-quinone oxidoreductase subunit E